MRTDFIDKATFSEVYRFLKNKPNSEIFQCFKNLFGVALLFFPALACKEVVGIIFEADIIGNIATGATLVGAGVGTIVSKAAKDAFSLFKNRDYVDYVTRYEQMQIAQVMIVYASYFDTISQCLPNENGEIVLSPDIKQKISNEGFQEYLKKFIESEQEQKDVHKILEKEFALPNPTQAFSCYKQNLKNFYLVLNEEFKKFFESLSFWREIDRETDDIDRAQKEYFSDLLHKLPELALCTYEKQYFELSKAFPEFAIWANHTEHVRIEEQIDIGFKYIAEQLKQLYTSGINVRDEVLDTLTHYYTTYTGFINKTIIEDDKKEVDEDIVFPLKKDIFIPQAFQALTYQKNMQLEQDNTWKEAYSGEEIGSYIRNILCHPKYGEFPMLILGLPGAGKTLLCHMLAAQILSAEYYVIIIRLRDAIAEDTIIKQINAQIENDLGDNCSWNDLRKADLDKPLVLIFDGYDELLQASGKTYSNYINKIAEFQADQRAIHNIFVRCIITSRVTLIDKAFIPHNCHILRLCDFDNFRIKTWCNIWNEANEQYFITHNLKKLEIASTGKINELAGQPLLLLMLALYDIDDNCLQEQGEIGRAELYYNLIRNFIKREKEKDSNFNQKSVENQKIVIKEGFRCLGIVALGMYNRNQLYIRTTELNRDIAFLTQECVSIDNIDDNALEEADKQVAGFFFVYSSEASAQIKGVSSKMVAYEFLHNTFGEFLMAHFILDVTFRLIRRQILDIEQEETFSWPEKLKREWYISLAYAPLFKRPVVLNMIHELSEIIAMENGIEVVYVQKALDNLFHEEIKHIIVGNIFSELNSTLNKQGNPFKHPELMLHVANYSINLILLRLIICSDNFVFTGTFGSDIDWEKLTYIWRYAFSEEELVGLSYLINLYHSKEEIKLTYNFVEEANNKVASLSKLDRLCQISNVLGDDIAYAIFGVFNVPLDQNIYSILKREGLKLETQYVLKRVMKCLMLSTLIEEELKDSLYELLKCCKKENDFFGLYVYFSLLHSLIDIHILKYNDIVHLLNSDIFQILKRVLDCAVSSNRWLFLNIILAKIIGCANALPISEKISLLHGLIDYYSYEIEHISFYLKNTRYVISVFLLLSKALQFIIDKNNMNEIGMLYYSFLRNVNIIYEIFSWKEMIVVMQICRRLLKIRNIKYGTEIFIYSINQISKKNPNMFTKLCSSFCLNSLIECYYYIFKNSKNITNDVYLRYPFKQYNKMRYIARKLLPLYEQSFYYLICLLCKDKLLSQQLGDDLPYVIKEYGYQLSSYTLMKIKEYGELIHNKGIKLEVEKILTRNY